MPEADSPGLSGKLFNSMDDEELAKIGLIRSDEEVLVDAINEIKGPLVNKYTEIGKEDRDYIDATLDQIIIGVVQENLRDFVKCGFTPKENALGYYSCHFMEEDFRRCIDQMARRILIDKR